MDDEGTGAESPQSLILSLWETLTTYWQVEFLVILFPVLGAVVWACLKLPRSRERVAAWLRHDAYGRNYRYLLERALDTTDHWVVPPEREDAPLTAARRAWTWKLYDRCLLFASCYPFALFLFGWMIAGVEAGIDDRRIFPEGASILHRVAAVLLLALSFFSTIFSEYISHRFGSRIARGVSALKILALFAVVFLVGKEEGTPSYLVVTTFGIAAASAIAVSVSRQSVSAIGLATLLVLTVSGLAGQIAAFFLNSAESFVVFSSAAAIIGADLSVFFVKRSERALSGTLLVSLMVFCLASQYIALALLGSDHAFSKNVIFFFVVLPVLSATFDFFALGCVRYLLRHSVRTLGWAWGIALSGLVAAAVRVIGLKVTAVVVVVGLNAAAGAGPAAGLVDLPLLLEDIEADPQVYWWLYLGFLTTLLPTFAHFFVMLWSVGGGVPRRTGAWLAGRAPYFSEDAIEAFWLWFGVTSYATATIALPVFAGWYAWQGIVWTYPQLGGALLDLARWLLATATALHDPA
ncbi:MAG: hypothetical protein AAGG47_12175 [Pseudomonadota bacterium]